MRPLCLIPTMSADGNRTPQHLDLQFVGLVKHGEAKHRLVDGVPILRVGRTHPLGACVPSCPEDAGASSGLRVHVEVETLVADTTEVIGHDGGVFCGHG